MMHGNMNIMLRITLYELKIREVEREQINLLSRVVLKQFKQYS